MPVISPLRKSGEDPAEHEVTSHNNRPVKQKMKVVLVSRFNHSDIINVHNLQCFDTVGWVTRRASGLQKILLLKSLKGTVN